MHEHSFPTRRSSDLATVLVGCHSPSPAHTQTPTQTSAPLLPFHPMLITTRGTNTSADGFWRVSISATGDSLELSHPISSKALGWSGSIWTTDSPGSWTAHEGWFVYLESESKVWTYDGDRYLNLLAVTPTWATWYGPDRFPCAVPSEVFSRLSESAQRAIKPNE
jgi:hypothetical protein